MGGKGRPRTDAGATYARTAVLRNPAVLRRLDEVADAERGREAARTMRSLTMPWGRNPGRYWGGLVSKASLRGSDTAVR